MLNFILFVNLFGIYYLILCNLGMIKFLWVCVCNLKKKWVWYVCKCMYNVEVNCIRKELIKDFMFKNCLLLFIVVLIFEVRFYDE